MPLQNVLPWIISAHRDGWAVGAFNAVNMEQAQAIAWAAEAEQAPAIIQFSHRALVYAGDGDARRGLIMLAAIGQAAVKNVSVPVCLHLDHAMQDEVALALDLEFPSVMFDAGDLPLEENISITRRLAELAHARGASLEAEVGEVPRVGISARMDPQAGLTRPEDAAAFVRASGVDTLAVAVGSVHSGKTKTLELDLERLRAIRAVVDLPLVLHGSSGVTDACITAGIALGLAKINIATQLSQGFTRAARRVLENDSTETDLRRYLGPARTAMVDVVRERIRTLGAAGKA